MQVIPIGTTIDLHFVIIFGNGIPGQTPTVELVRQKDGAYFNGTIFTLTPVALPMAEVDAVNLPGVYRYTFDQTIDNDQEQYIAYYENTGAFAGVAFEEFFFTNITADVNTLSIAMAVASKILVNQAIPIDSSDIASQALLEDVDTDVDNISNSMALQSTLLNFESEAMDALNQIISIIQPLSGSNLVTFNILDQDSLPVPDVKITIKNTISNITLAVATTDINGQVTLGLPNGTYNVLFWKSFYTFGTQPYSLVVTTNQTVNISATSFTPASVLPNMCTLYSYVLDATGQPVAGVDVRLKMIDTMPFNSTGSSLITKGWITVQTNAMGYWSLNAIQGATIELSIPALLFSLSDFTVPAQANLDISTLTGLVN